jgi:hypothetical protein
VKDFLVLLGVLVPKKNADPPARAEIFWERG